MRFMTFTLLAGGLALAGCGGYDDDTIYEAPTPATTTDTCVPINDDAQVGDLGYDEDGVACTLGAEDLEAAGVDDDTDGGDVVDDDPDDGAGDDDPVDDTGGDDDGLPPYDR